MKERGFIFKRWKVTNLNFSWRWYMLARIKKYGSVFIVSFNEVVCGKHGGVTQEDIPTHFQFWQVSDREKGKSWLIIPQGMMNRWRFIMWNAVNTVFNKIQAFTKCKHSDAVNYHFTNKYLHLTQWHVSPEER